MVKLQEKQIALSLFCNCLVLFPSLTSFYGLNRTLKLIISAFLSLALRGKTSIFPAWKLTDALPKLWKDRILSSIGNSINLCISDHHLIKKNLYCLHKL